MHPGETEPVTAADRREEIARLEDEIENLADALERCRKIGIAAKVAMAAGLAALISVPIGLVTLAPLVLVVAITAAIGGLVAYGSNVSTERQAMAELKAAEVFRAQLIEASDLRLVAPVPHPRSSGNGSLRLSEK
jgi:hypothetical protein